jgi:SAM-dependent methyltransferase
LEERKRHEIEHSRQRRLVLKGYERRLDTHESEQVVGRDNLIVDKEAFERHGANLKYYSITGASDAYEREWLKKHCMAGVKVLDFACGNGENGIFAATCGADVIGIDISPEGVDNANANAREAKVSDRCVFKVMDGENMTFPDDMFDLGVEYGALHHVELDRALSELRRVIKPGGKMICVEALRHNPLIHAYRKRTPHLRTPWEVDHILGVESLDVVRKYFRSVDVRFFHLAVLAAVPFRKTMLFRPLRWFLDRVDDILLSNRLIGKYAWIMVFVMSDPIKK